jgi:hypothetical protein
MKRIQGSIFAGNHEDLNFNCSPNHCCLYCTFFMLSFERQVKACPLAPLAVRKRFEDHLIGRSLLFTEIEERIPYAQTPKPVTHSFHTPAFMQLRHVLGLAVNSPSRGV